jgi:MoaA/NifB/PqqE/SkfB family radical SAM enzyme
MSLLDKAERMGSYYRGNGLPKTLQFVGSKLARRVKNQIDLYSSCYTEHGLADTLGLVGRRAKVVLPRYPFRYRYPSAITIEIMDVCNLKCKHCYLQAQSSFAPRGFMDYSFFAKIIERISPLLKRASLLNFDSVEPLFHKRIFDMIDLVRNENKYITVNINTNAMLLDDDRIDNLLKRGIYDFLISLDGCKKNTVESFKTGADFDRVVSNIKKLRAKGGEKVRIRMNFVAHKNNIDELMDYIDFCGKLDAKTIVISGFIAYVPEMVDWCLYSEDGIGPINELYRKAKHKSEELGMVLIHHGTKLKPRGCGFAAGLMYIDKTGNVVPCVLLSKKTRMALLDRIGMTERIVWGNVLEGDSYRIWTSRASVDFRRLLHDEKLPPQCELCAIGYKVIC